MRDYSFFEMEDIHFMYYKANANARKACRFYEEAYLERANHCEKIFIQLHQRIRENGSFDPLSK